MNFAANIQIDDHLIGKNHPTFIIAEAGVNHNGCLDNAKKLVDVALESGVNAVKFQLFNTDNLILNDVAKADYQEQNGASGSTQYEMLKSLELTIDQMQSLKNYCDDVGITFIATPFDALSLDALLALNVSALKISSTDITNIHFLEKASAARVPVILSTGMSYHSEVEQALQIFADKKTDLMLLHCTSSYPFPTDESNLKVIQRFSQAFGIIAGYSDHSEDIGVSPFAVAAGAKVIEKHFTLDKAMPGPDHKASLSPTQLNQFVQEIRKVDEMMGSDIKTVTLSESGNRLSLQKSIVASQDIHAGEKFSRQNLTAKRTGGVGIPASYWHQVIDTTANADYAIDDIIKL